MKRKDPTKTSPVKTKKGRTSIGEISSPAPAALSVEEQKRRAKEWFENEERKKLEASASKPNRSTTPTTKTPAKKAKREVEEEPAPRSTRKSTRAVETPSKNRTLSAKVEVEFIESDDEEEDEEEEEVVAPAPKARKTASAKVTKEEPVLAVKTPRSARKAAPAKASTPKLTPDADSPVVAARKTALEIEREKAQAWYANELKKKAEEEATKSASKSATKAPKSATKTAKSTTTTPAKPVASVVRPAGHPVASANSSSSSPGACPFAFPTEPERERPAEQTTTSTTTAAVAHNDAHQIHAVSAALALVPLGVVAYYDPKIAVTALVILFVASVVRRIVAMIMDAEKNI